MIHPPRRCFRLHSPSVVLVVWAAVILAGAGGPVITAIGLVLVAAALAVAELERKELRRELARRDRLARR